MPAGLGPISMEVGSLKSGAPLPALITVSFGSNAMSPELGVKGCTERRRS